MNTVKIFIKNSKNDARKYFWGHAIEAFDTFFILMNDKTNLQVEIKYSTVDFITSSPTGE